ncbi:MAG: DUF4391 domain-containing protein [Aeromonas sp.]
MPTPALSELFWQHWQAPARTHLGVLVTKKTLLASQEYRSEDKGLIKDVLQQVQWRDTLKPSTVNIPAFTDQQHEYLEIAVLAVQVKDKRQTKALCRLLHQAIPYPLLLVLSHERDVALSLARKRISQTDSSQLMLVQQIDSGWLLHSEFDPCAVARRTTLFRQCAFNALPTISLYDTYHGLIDALQRFQAASLLGEAHLHASHLQGEALSASVQELNQLEAQLSALKNQAKKCTQLRQQVQLNQQAQQIKQRINALSEMLM